MTWWIWTFVAVPVYLVGFVVAGAIEQRACDNTNYGKHTYCSHPFATPAPTFWPLVIAIGLPLAVVAGPLFLAASASRWLATRETASERRDRLAVERDQRVREHAATIAHLEREAGIR